MNLEKEDLKIGNRYIYIILKLLGLLLILSEMLVLKIIVYPETLYEKLYLFHQLPLIVEYLTVSSLMYVGGVIFVWQILRKQ